MQKKTIIFAAVAALLLLFAFRYEYKPAVNNTRYISRQEAFKNKAMLQCTPDWNLLNGDSLAKGIPILRGWGNYQWKIDSYSDSARQYFQQGINMYYSFHIIEAMASFKKAQVFDSSNAMIYWGQALAYGPNINDFAYSATPEAFAATQKAKLLAANCTEREKHLIKAMTVRYTSDSTVSRKSLNQLYTNAMQDAYQHFSKDGDIAALYADAMMLQHPWEYWKHNGDAEEWTPRILAVLEKTLKESPNHPGSNHYYIHTVEASGNPHRALPSADRLSKMMPSVSHMVHMPSHIYIRSGMYNEGAKVNELSLKGYNDYLSVYPDVVNNAPLYLIHNLHMQTACAMLGKGYEYSAKAAGECRASFDTSYMSFPAPFGNFIQFVYMTPVFNNIRFGKWQQVLEGPPIPAHYSYANVMDHWAKGIALAKTNKLAAAKRELQFVQENMNLGDMLVVLEPFNAPVSAAKVAEKLLEGIIAEQENDLPTAILAFNKAVEFEDALIYNEPKDWLLPARQYLGDALWKEGSFSKAATIFKADLKENPNNHWALQGLYKSLQKQKQYSAARVIKIQLEKISATDDLKNLPAVF